MEKASRRQRSEDVTDPTTGGSTGVSQQDPTDSNSEFTVIDFMITQRLALLDTIKPCQVAAVHPGTGSPPAAGTVDVQLLLSLLDGDGNATQQGIVYGVPYVRLHGGKWQVVLDPAVGDIGFLACSDRDISALKSAITSGASPLVNPGSFRKLSVSDGIYVGGFGNKVPAGSVWLKTDGTFQINDKLGNVLQSGSAGLTFTPPAGGGLLVNGYVHATGEVVRGLGGGDSVTLGSHTHEQANDSHGDGEQPTNPPTAGT